MAQHGYDVHLIVADDKGDELINEVHVHDVGFTTNRFTRILKSAYRAYKKALEIDAAIYHFHDPELIPYGNKLLKKGKKVIYDVHEDVPRSIVSKDWIWKPIREMIAFSFEKYEDHISAKLSGIICATPFIRDRFLKNNLNTVDINNYPLLKEFGSVTSWANKSKSICYVGGLTKIRGIYEIVHALKYCDARLLLGGNFDYKEMEEELKKHHCWGKVDYFGFVERSKVAEILEKSKAGLVTFYPEPNHINAQPNKLFEYMSAGIPVICSNFPLWKEIIEKNQCGVCVNPLDPKDIANGVNTILSDDLKSEQMGKNGRKAIETKYNWENEFQRLLSFYSNILK